MAISIYFIVYQARVATGSREAPTDGRQSDIGLSRTLFSPWESLVATSLREFPVGFGFLGCGAEVARVLGRLFYSWARRDLERRGHAVLAPFNKALSGGYLLLLVDSKVCKSVALVISSG